MPIISNPQFRQWGGAETPCELKERMKITVVSGLGEDVKVVRGVAVCELDRSGCSSNKPKTERSFPARRKGRLRDSPEVPERLRRPGVFQQRVKIFR